jgi:hypothetical protein
LLQNKPFISRLITPHVPHLPAQVQNAWGESELPGRDRGKTKCETKEQGFVHGSRPKGAGASGDLQNYVSNLEEFLAPKVRAKTRADEHMVDMCAFLP